MIKHSTGRKMYNFNDIDLSSQQEMPKEISKPGKSYNFTNDDSDDDKHQSNIGRISQGASARGLSEKDILVRETAEEEAVQKSSPVNQAIERERKIQQSERDKKFTEEFLTAIIKSEEEKLLNNLLQFANEKKLTLMQTYVLLFLLLKESLKNPCSYCVEENYAGVIAMKSPIMLDQLNSLKKWGVYTLRTMGEEVEKIIEKRKAPKRLGKLAEHRIKELVEEFEMANNYDDCLAVCNIEDMAFRDSYEFSSSKEMKNELRIISSCTPKAIPHTAWLVDLSLTLLYFDPIPLEDLLKDLNRKYTKTLHPFLAPHFLLLNLTKGSQQSMKDAAAQIVSNSPKQLEELNQILFMWAMNSYRSKTADIFEKTVKNILKFTRSPSLFVDFLCFLRLDSVKVKTYFDFFLNQNIFVSQNSKEKLMQLKSYIQLRNNQRLQRRSDESTIQILIKWVKCEIFLHQGDKIKSLKYLQDNFKQLSTPVIHSSSEIYKSMIDSILIFDLVCTYKIDQKRELIKVLDSLSRILSEGKDKRIIKGIIAFIQLKSKVFCFNSKQKFDDFYFMFGILEEREVGGDKSSKRIKASLIKALSNSLESFQGELHLHQLISRYSNSQLTILAKLIDSPESLEVAGEDKSIRESPIIKLASMLKTVPKITRKIVTILLL